jgi:hypothetical protein
MFNKKKLKKFKSMHIILILEVSRNKGYKNYVFEKTIEIYVP